MGRDPTNGGERSKIGRYEEIQTWVVYFQCSFFPLFKFFESLS